MGPTFVAIALGMLINLGMYESMIAEALHTGIVFYLSGLLYNRLSHAVDQFGEAEPCGCQWVSKSWARDRAPSWHRDSPRDWWLNGTCGRPRIRCLT
jgi:hypothetical protein